jgi:hypothetical protein
MWQDFNSKVEGNLMFSVSCKKQTKEKMENTIKDNKNKEKNYNTNYKKD